MIPPRKHAAGFTLIETLVALVVAAAAAAVIAATVRGLYDHARRQTRMEGQVLDLVNLSVRLAYLPWREGVQQDDAKDLTLQPTSPEIPVINVANFQLRESMPLPPRNVAYTPFQRFTLSGSNDDRLTLHFIAPGLKPPPGTYMPSGLVPDSSIGTPPVARKSPTGNP